jgi:hypothetical protein
MDVEKAIKGLTALSFEIHCNHIVGLPSVKFAVFLIAKSFWENVGASEEYLR